MITTTAPKENSVHNALMPARLISIDIETGNASKEVIQAAVDLWTPPGNVKDKAKIDERRNEYAAKTREKSALLDGSPIACIAVKTDRMGIVFNGCDKEDHKVEGSAVISAGDEASMLAAFREWANAAASEETILVGFNLWSFDLPRIRAAFMRHRLKLPKILQPRLLDDERQPSVDVMKLFLKNFTSEYADERYISLSEVIQKLGLPGYKDVISGAMVPKLLDEGKVAEVLAYCFVDTLSTMDAFLLMTSNHANQK